MVTAMYQGNAEMCIDEAVDRGIELGHRKLGWQLLALQIWRD